MIYTMRGCLQNNALEFSWLMPTPHEVTVCSLTSPVDACERLFPDLEMVELALGEVLYESGSKLGHVFPTTSIVSLLYVMEDGAAAEIAVVGNEGVVGVALFMGGETTPSRAVVQNAGLA
jgi:hypothetical protein